MIRRLELITSRMRITPDEQGGKTERSLSFLH
jgi:hypothetical protein